MINWTLGVTNWTNQGTGSAAGSNGPHEYAQGAVLTPAAGVITPTDPFHHVAAGTITTIATTNLNTAVVNELVIIADGAITVTFGGNIVGHTAALATNDVVRYVLDGTSWREGAAFADSALTSNVALLNRNSQVFTGTPQSFSGSVAIGTAGPPTYRLDVRENFANFAASITNASGSPGSAGLYILTTNTTSLTPALAIDANNGATHVLYANNDGSVMFGGAVPSGGLGNLKTVGTITERARTTPMGEWITFTPTLTTSSAATWGAGVLSTAKYTLIGKTMTVTFYYSTSSISAATALALRVGIPGSFVAATYMGGSFLNYNEAGGTRTTGFCRVVPGGTVIELYHADQTTNWAASTTNADVVFALTFEVQ